MVPLGGMKLFRPAANLLIVILCSVIVFHLLVMMGIVPREWVWGGHLRTTKDVVVFESVAVVVGLVIVAVVSGKKRYMRSGAVPGVVNMILWVFALMFVLNTAGNMVATTSMESKIFTPISAVSALLCVLVAAARGEQ